MQMHSLYIEQPNRLTLFACLRNAKGHRGAKPANGRALHWLFAETNELLIVEDFNPLGIELDAGSYRRSRAEDNSTQWPADRALNHEVTGNTGFRSGGGCSTSLPLTMRMTSKTSVATNSWARVTRQ